MFKSVSCSTWQSASSILQQYSLLVVDRSGPVERYVVCLVVMLSSKVPQEVINSDRVHSDVLQSDVVCVTPQQTFHFLHYQLSRPTYDAHITYIRAVND